MVQLANFLDNFNSDILPFYKENRISLLINCKFKEHFPFYQKMIFQCMFRCVVCGKL